MYRVARIHQVDPKTIELPKSIYKMPYLYAKKIHSPLLNAIEKDSVRCELETRFANGFKSNPSQASDSRDAANALRICKSSLESGLQADCTKKLNVISRECIAREIRICSDLESPPGELLDLVDILRHEVSINVELNSHAAMVLSLKRRDKCDSSHLDVKVTILFVGSSRDGCQQGERVARGKAALLERVRRTLRDTGDLSPCDANRILV